LTRLSTRPWRRQSGALPIAVAAAMPNGLAGCVVSPVQPRFAGEVVAVAPPAAQVEVICVPHAAGCVWLGGYRNWVGGRHVWVGGRWDVPRPGYYLEPHVRVHAGADSRLREGHWARR
jgi:hypothetical protein